MNLARTLLVRLGTLERLATALDLMSPAGRVQLVRSARRAEMAKLWRLAQVSPPVDAAALVTGGRPLVESVHEGKNSMLAFTRFRKRFCLAPDDPRQAYGYNDQPFLWLTGPGYFVAHAAEPGAPAAFALDHTRMPLAKPYGWPELESNDGPIARIVHGGLIDFVRRVSSHVSIGMVSRHGKPTGHYFLLCRREP